MSPTRRSTGTYKPPRDRHELVVAALAGLGVLAFTGVMIWVLAPEDETAPSVPSFTIPSNVTTLPVDPNATTLPGDTTVTTPTSAPG
jgi:hypothetical protein